MNNNYYLNLLYKKVMELKTVLKEIEESDYSSEYKKYLISGYIITLDSILEIGISDLHSQDLDELTSLIYYTRQKAVHYGYFNGLHNVDDIANKIINLTEKHYERENEFYNSLFEKSNFELKCDNLLIKSSQNITVDNNFFRFKTSDGNKELCIPIKKVFTLTKKSKEKISSYIVDLDAIGSLYTYENGSPVAYEEITQDKLKDYLKENFMVLEENYNKHNETIYEIITNFHKNPTNTIQIMEFASNEQFCRNTIDVIKDFITENTMFEAYIEHNHLIKDKYSLNKMQKADYAKLQKTFKKNVAQYMTQKDAFFVNMTIKRAKFYFDQLQDYSASFDVNIELLSPILIQLFETGPKHFSNQFISSSPEFKKCYSNLLRYRQIYSHYLLSNKEYKDGLEKFKTEFLDFIKLLQMIDLDEVKNTTPENYDTYRLLEREKEDFFNYKHEQFLRIDEKTYIGKKINYSSRNAKSDKLIAIIPPNTIYYEKDALDYLKPSYVLDKSTGKMHHIPISKQTLDEMKEVKIDFNLSNLFKAYNLLKKVKNNGEIQIYFRPCKENENYRHYDNLETVILRFFNQGYLPVELLRKTKLNISNVNQGLIDLTDEEGNVIANIINKKKFSIDNDSIKDEKRFFSRIDDINHNFSRRRHSKWLIKILLNQYL